LATGLTGWLDYNAARLGDPGHVRQDIVKNRAVPPMDG
jgi:hypothetical protein